MTGIELIAQERKEQIEKHGRTIEKDAEYNDEEQLLEALLLLLYSMNTNASFLKEPPKGWNKNIWVHTLSKSDEEKLSIMGAFCAAEIDRRNYIKNLKQQ